MEIECKGTNDSAGADPAQLGVLTSRGAEDSTHGKDTEKVEGLIPDKPAGEAVSSAKESSGESVSGTKELAKEQVADVSAEEGVRVIDDPPESLRKRSRSLEEALERRRRRRRLRRMLREAGEFPSFVALISNVEDNGNDTVKKEKAEEEEKEKETPDVIYIDVDEYLGLSADKKIEPASADKPDSMPSAATSSTPAEEGYYEGRVPLSSPDDDQYLTTLQQLIRSNLEYFSATATDAAGSQAGRRYPIVQGKVGIRCIHCAKVALEHEAALAAKMAEAPIEPDKPGSAVNEKDEDDNTNNDDDDAAEDPIKPKMVDPSLIWPPGSISYPLNVGGLYSICSQKPQLHFEHCPNLPPTIMAQMYRHLNGEASKAGEIRVKSREVPASMYYTVAAKRIGLVNVPGGLRFGRDLTLEPLPLDAVLAQEMQESNEKKRVLVAPPILPDRPMVAPEPVAPYVSKFKADADSEQVLKEAIAEPDDQPNHLARAEDKNTVTDYFFLIARQMSVCRAVPADFATRGKKTRKMRIGFAGFCCRHCLKVREEADGNELARANATSGFSCRSFSSTAETFASGIANTFGDHLAKCSNTPKRIRSALAVYKQIHPDQKAELPHGSQQQCVNLLWRRLRHADIDEGEMNRRIKTYKPGEPDFPAFINTDVKESLRPKTTPKPSRRRSSSTKPKPGGRGGAEFPTSTNSETKRVLSEAEENWDSSGTGENGGMIVPSDRPSVSDYMFLTCRNLKVAMPTEVDVTKRGLSSQNLMAGMCCMHCEGKDPSMIEGSSRSFPTAPDNYSSALNSSLYNHMQKCHFIRDDVKRTLADLRKIHSSQLAHFEIGSQRRFFTRLCSRLKKVQVKGKLPPGPPKAASPSPRRASRSSNTKSGGGGSSRSSRSTRGGGDDAILGQFKFFEAPLQSFFCLRCRMVPLQFRARGSLSFAKPTLDFMSEHHDSCKKDGFDLWFCVESLKEVLKTTLDVASLSHPLFKEVILECFGRNEELSTIFTSEIIKVYQMSKHGGVTQSVESYVQRKSQGMWAKLPKVIDSAKVLQAFEKFAATVEGLSPRLTDHDALVKYLLLISPSLSLQEGDEDEAGSEEEEEGGDEEEKGEEEILAKPTGRRGGKELRRKKIDDDEGDIDSETEVLKPAGRRRGKELRRKTTEEEEDEEEEGGGDDDEDEVIEITPRKTRGGKEPRRNRSPVLDADGDEEEESIDDLLEDDDEDGDLLEDDDDDGDEEEDADNMDGGSEAEQEESVMEEESVSGSNGDVFEDEGLIPVEGGGGDHSDPDALMREGIDEDLDGEVSREQMELDDELDG